MTVQNDVHLLRHEFISAVDKSTRISGEETLDLDTRHSLSSLSLTPTSSTSSITILEPTATMSTEEILARRRSKLGQNVTLFFPDDPLHIVKGQGCQLFDSEGRSYLDCINNVSHVGHSHPRVAAAVSQQLFTLNTNSRYLHEGLVTLADRLTATMPPPLDIFFPVVSGSEANDLALRIACRNASSESGTSTSNEEEHWHVAVMDFAYHGITSACVDLSPYKFMGPGGSGKPSHVHVLPCPDVFRGTNLDGAAAAKAAVAAAEAAGGRIVAFFCESLISCGGQVVLPPGYLEVVYKEMRAAGAVCVADEVQCGFGRMGSHFWAFEMQQVVPDIVTFGKPMGNGFPCAGLVTKTALGACFANGMEFFSTYGGCTAAAAAALAVLDVLRDEQLVENAARVGEYCISALLDLQKQFPEVIGDVRGQGLMIGVELIDPHNSSDNVTKIPEPAKIPAPATAAWIKARCKNEHHVLLSTEGPFSNVIKIKPPMCFSTCDVDRMVAALSEAFVALAALVVQGSGEEAAALKMANDEAVAAVVQRRAAFG